jgi:hypothetical protein
MNRALRMLLLMVVVTALAACAGEPVVSADDVESQATDQFSQQFPVDSVDCPEDLPAEVGASIQCVLVSEGSSFEMTATTTRVEGDNVDFDLELTAEL